MSRWRGAKSVTSRPPIEISPLVTSSSPAIARSNVDFPQPDGPTSAMNSPSPIERDTSSIATTSPEKTFVRFRSSISAMCAEYGYHISTQLVLTTGKDRRRLARMVEDTVVTEAGGDPTVGY